jgi:hypothetical protein
VVAEGVPVPSRPGATVPLAKAVAFKLTRLSLWKDENTGDGTAREVDEFIVHPNRFKSELGVGEAVMVIPHEAGSKAINIKFRKYDDLSCTKNMETTQKVVSKGLDLPDTVVPSHKGDSNEKSEKSF